MIEFRMPSLGADMDVGTVLEWRVRPGDRVKRGDVVALVDTEKAEIEVEIWDAGIVDGILVPPGQKVPVGTLLATLRSEAEAPAGPAEREAAAGEPARAAEPAAGPARAPRPAAEPARGPAVPEPTAVAAPRRAPPPPEPGAAGPPRAEPARARVTPLARRLARELGVDLARVAGHGPDGAVTADDVRAAAGARAPAAPPAAEEARGLSPERLAAVRRRIALAMERSKREIPHYYLETQVDVSRTLAWLEAENLKRPVTERLLLAPLLLRAVAAGVAAAPELNGHWVDGSFRPGAGVHVGFVISLRGGGLLVPTLRDVDRKGVDELMRELREATARARRGTLRGVDVSEATLTVTSLGEGGVETVFGVIYPPQVALAGFGRVTERPWAEGGLVGARPVVTATLSADHRASDGQRGARFLAAVARVLSSPEAT
jgi:pyruvate dehydrogenase E2 component (dihydrolipoamide acetyltransferase)